MGEVKEGRVLQAVPIKGMPVKEEVPSSTKGSAVSRLDNKEGGDIKAYPRWRHTPSKDQVTRLSGRCTKTLSIKSNIDLWSIACWLATNPFYFFILFYLSDCLISKNYKLSFIHSPVYCFFHQQCLSS